jgi:uncharacterized membrane protein YgdD (TMEM256/DUF423 family)
MNRSLLFAAALLGGIAVLLGAFAAHALKEIFPPESLSIFETGVRYQIYHVMAIFIAVLLADKMQSAWQFRWAGNFFLIGIILFSGSLYLLATLKARGIGGLGALGILTPIGGLFFIGGWLLLCAGLLRKK